MHIYFSQKESGSQRAGYGARSTSIFTKKLTMTLGVLKGFATFKKTGTVSDRMGVR